MPVWIDVILLEYTKLQNIKYVLNTMTIWDPISIRKVGIQYLCKMSKEKGKKEKELMANN